MNSNQDQLSQPLGSTRSTSLTAATGHTNLPHAPVHQVLTINPLHALNDPSEAHRYLSRLFPTHVPQSSPDLPSSSSTSSYTTATPSPTLSVRMSSTRYSSLQPTSTRPSPAQSSPLPLPRNDTRSVPSKRAREHTPNPPALYPASSVSQGDRLYLKQSGKRSTHFHLVCERSSYPAAGLRGFAADCP